MKMNLKMKLGALMISVMADGAHATEWTDIIDGTVSIEQTYSYSGDLSANDEAFWIGASTAIHTATGQFLDPYALTERLDASKDGQYPVVSATSSQRGKIWSQVDDDLNGYVFQPDAEGNFWVDARTPMDFVELKADGTSRLRSSADLGYAGLCVHSVRPLQDAAGATVVLGNCDPAGANAKVLRLDAFGRVSAALAIPGCARDAFDDRNGGYFTTC